LLENSADLFQVGMRGIVRDESRKPVETAERQICWI